MPHTELHQPKAARAACQSLPRQFARFAAVGVVGTAMHYGVMLALVEVAGFNPVAGTCAGFLASLGASYTLNRLWTFAKSPPVVRSFAAYLFLCGIGLGINMTIVAAAIAAGFHYMVGQIVATLVALLWNFASARFLVFR
jgi:putative flippase GtrA